MSPVNAGRADHGPSLTMGDAIVSKYVLLGIVACPALPHTPWHRGRAIECVFHVLVASLGPPCRVQLRIRIARMGAVLMVRMISAILGCAGFYGCPLRDGFHPHLYFEAVRIPF
jgi:hypothetical protein